MTTWAEISTALAVPDDGPSSRAAVARAAIEGAPADVKKGVAKDAVQSLSSQDQAELRKLLWPQESSDRKAVYVVGFVVAAVIAIAFALIAWGASDSGNDAVSTAVLVAMTGITGAILGGLFGAYKG
jgi:preprotein translocase subunit SecE